MPNTLILGIGNTLLSDEGIGVHVLDFLQKHHQQDGVSYIDGGTLSFALAADIEDHQQLIVIDAAQLGAEAGTVQCMEDVAMDDFLGSVKRSVHEVGLLDLMDIARLTDSLPRRRALIGIQPDVVDWGERPTARVEAAIPEAASQALQLVERWAQQPSPEIREALS